MIPSSLRPISSAMPVANLKDVANANKVMPPKSTWFEPKLLDGLLSHKI